jgi:hypothetical protein
VLLEDSRGGGAFAAEAGLAKRSVLVIDEDFLAGLGLRAMIEELGHDVVVAHSMDAAKSILARRKDIDLVVTGDGLRAHGAEPCTDIGDVSVVCATNRRPTCGGRGCVMMAKPFSVQAVARVLERAALHENVVRCLREAGARPRSESSPRARAPRT